MNKIGLIAGNGLFPLEFARAAKAKGMEVIVVAHKDETTPDIEGIADHVLWIKVGQLGKLIKFFREQGVKDALMAGGIKKTHLFSNLRPDLKGAALLARMIHNKDDQILRAVAQDLEAEGITVRESTLLLDNILAPAGVLTKRKPSKDERIDISFGWQMAKAIGGLDIGQTVVVKNRTVLAVEAVEGTDQAIRRGGSLGRKDAVVVKVCKPQQDLRFDLPATGMQTIETMQEVKASCLAVEAGKTIILEQEKVIAAANTAGIAIVAITDADAQASDERG